tara:strand:- start:527 stop:796 length:270 start_codon:yes stop_codon:yes gene_type:complete
MTDLSSSKEEMADMAAELISAKMDSARSKSEMTNVLRIGSFHMEIIPDRDIDIREMFNEVLDKLIAVYGSELLEINLQDLAEKKMNHYG